MRALASFIIRGRMQALMVVLLAGGLGLIIPPLLLFSGAALGLVTLRRGAVEGVSILLFATVAMALLFMLSPASPAAAVLYVAVAWAPVLVFALILRATVSLPLVIFGAVILGEIFLVTGWGLIPGEPGQWWYENLLLPVYEPMLQQQALPEAQREMIMTELRALGNYMTGYVAVALALVPVICLLIARWWQAMLFNPGGFRQEFHGLKLGRRFGIIAAAMILLGILPLGEVSALLREAAAPVLMLASLQGLAIVHSVVARRSANPGWLVTLYILVIFATVPVMFLLAVMAVMDSWLDFRGRVPAGGRPPKGPDKDE